MQNTTQNSTQKTNGLIPKFFSVGIQFFVSLVFSIIFTYTVLLASSGFDNYFSSVYITFFLISIFGTGLFFATLAVRITKNKSLIISVFLLFASNMAIAFIFSKSLKDSGSIGVEDNYQNYLYSSYILVSLTYSFFLSMIFIAIELIRRRRIKDNYNE